MNVLPDGIRPEMAAFMDAIEPFIHAEHQREWEGKLPPPKSWRDAHSDPANADKLALLCEALASGIDAAIRARASATSGEGGMTKREIIARAINPDAFRDGDVGGLRANQRRSSYAIADRIIAAVATPDDELREALVWYAENVAGCRKLGRIGDPFRHALDADGGSLARAALDAAERAKVQS